MKALIAAAAVVALAAPATAQARFLHIQDAKTAVAHRLDHNEAAGLSTGYIIESCRRPSHTFAVCTAVEFDVPFGGVTWTTATTPFYVHLKKTGRIVAHDDWR